MKNQDRILRPLLWGAVLSTLTSISLAQPIDEVLERQLEAARKVYQVEQWPIGARRAGLDLQRLSLPGFVGLEATGEEGLVTRRFRTADANKKPAFHIELRVTETAREAHEVLLGWVTSVSADKLVPTGTQLDLATGDISFVGPTRLGFDRPLWYGFVRGNLALRLSAHDLREGPVPDLVALARTLDRQVGGDPVLPAGNVLPKPKIEAFSCSAVECTEGVVLPLELSVVDPAGRTARPRFIVGGPGQGYVERDADGVWQLHTTGPGAITLKVEVMASTGTFATRELRLVVNDD